MLASSLLSSGAASAAPSVMTVSRAVEFRGVPYTLGLTISSASFSVHLERETTLEHWYNSFVPDYIDDLTRKAGAQRKYQVFLQMLVSALERTSRSPGSVGAALRTQGVSLDLLFVEDVEKLSAERAAGDPEQQSRFASTFLAAKQKSRCYLTLTYAAEFERTAYNLALDKCSLSSGEPYETWLLESYKQCKAELQTLRKRMTALGGPAAAQGAVAGAAAAVAPAESAAAGGAAPAPAAPPAPCQSCANLEAENRHLKEIIVRLDAERKDALQAAEFALKARDKVRQQYTVLIESLRERERERDERKARKRAEASRSASRGGSRCDRTPVRAASRSSANERYSLSATSAMTSSGERSRSRSERSYQRGAGADRWRPREFQGDLKQTAPYRSSSAHSAHSAHSSIRSDAGRPRRSSSRASSRQGAASYASSRSLSRDSSRSSSLRSSRASSRVSSRSPTPDAGYTPREGAPWQRAAEPRAARGAYPRPPANPEPRAESRPERPRSRSRAGSRPSRSATTYSSALVGSGGSTASESQSKRQRLDEALSKLLSVLESSKPRD